MILKNLIADRVCPPPPPPPPGSTSDWDGARVYHYGQAVSYSCPKGRRFGGGGGSLSDFQSRSCDWDLQWKPQEEALQFAYKNGNRFSINIMCNNSCPPAFGPSAAAALPARRRRRDLS